MNEIIVALEREIADLKKEHSFIAGEYCHAQNIKMKWRSWKDLYDRTEARIKRLEAIVAQLRALPENAHA